MWSGPFLPYIYKLAAVQSQPDIALAYNKDSQRQTSVVRSKVCTHMAKLATNMQTRQVKRNLPVAEAVISVVQSQSQLFWGVDFRKKERESKREREKDEERERERRLTGFWCDWR